MANMFHVNKITFRIVTCVLWIYFVLDSHKTFAEMCSICSLDDTNRNNHSDHLSKPYFLGRGTSDLELLDKDEIGRERWASVLKPLDIIIKRNLKSCSLALFYENDTAITALSLSRTIQGKGTKLYHLSTDILRQRVTWDRSSCDAYIFLLLDGRDLVSHASINHFKSVPYRPGHKPPFLWNYEAYYIVVFLHPTPLQPKKIIKLYNFRKTANLIILQEKKDRTIAWTHSLISGTPSLAFLDSWTNDRFIPFKMETFFPKKFEDFQGMAVDVATFEHAPSVVYAMDSKGNFVGRLGVDMEVIHGLSIIKNFTVNFVEVSYTEKWGMKYPNGSWDGLMREVYDDLSDIGVCNVFIDDFRWSETDFSYPYNFMPGCFVAPSPKPLSRWQSPLLPFSWSTWVSIGISLIVGGPILYIIAIVSVKAESRKFRSISFNYLYMLGSLTSRSLNVIPAHVPGRIYTGFVWICCLIISTGYSANLIAFLSVTQMTPPIDTLDQLVKSGLRLGGHSFWKTQFEVSTDPRILKLASIIETDVHYLDVFKDVETGEFSFVENKQYLELNRDARFTYGDLSTIRIVRECFVSYSIALILPRNSPITDSLTNALLRIFESGMMTKWQAEVTKYFRNIYSEERSKSKTVKRSRSEALHLGHVQGIFYIMGVGYLLAFAIFINEKLLK